MIRISELQKFRIQEIWNLGRNVVPRVIPAKAGIQKEWQDWIPTFVGMTRWG
jgi:hypothetical protein